MRFGIAVVHAEHFGREERGLIAAGAGANFKNYVLLVVRIFRQQQDLEFFLDGADARFEFVQLFLRVRPHLRIFFVGEHGLALGDALFQILELAVFLDDFRNLAVGLCGLLIFRRVANDLRRGERLRQLFVAGFDLVKSFKHKNRRRLSVAGQNLSCPRCERIQ